jgi:hypothetical protein
MRIQISPPAKKKCFFYILLNLKYKEVSLSGKALFTLMLPLSCLVCKKSFFLLYIINIIKYKEVSLSGKAFFL